MKTAYPFGDVIYLEGRPFNNFEKLVDSYLFKGGVFSFFSLFAASFTFMILFMISPWSLIFTIPMLFIISFCTMDYAIS